MYVIDEADIPTPLYLILSLPRRLSCSLWKYFRSPKWAPTLWTLFSGKNCESIFTAFTAAFTGSANFSRSSLGQTLTTAPSYSLRQLAGLLLHRVYTLGVSAESFFPSAELAKSFSNAVLSAAPDSRVLDGLANFFEQCSDHRYYTQTSSPNTTCLTSSSYGPVAFTSHVAVGNQFSVVDQQLGITISICKDIGVLTIGFPPLPNTIAVYIDIPLESAELHKTRVSNKEEAQKNYVIEISLKSESQASFYINSSPDRSQRLNIGYSSKKSADDAYSILKSMLSESTSATEIGKLAYAKPWNKFSSKFQYSVSSRGESEISANLRNHSEILSKDMESDVPVEKGVDDDLVECASTSPAGGSTVLDGNSDGVLYGDTASEFTDQDQSETRGTAESALYNHDQHSDSHGESGSDEALANDVASSSPNPFEEQSEMQRSRGERPSSLELQTPIEESHRSPTPRRKAPSDPAVLLTKAALKKQSGVKASARHTKLPFMGGAENSDEMWDVGLEIEAEPGPINLQSQHVSEWKEHPPKVGPMPFRPSEGNDVRVEQARAEKTGKGNAASKSTGVKKPSTRNASTEDANIGKSRTVTIRKGERCIERTEREVASSPTAEAGKEIPLPRRSKRAAATQAQRKIEDQVSSEEASDNALASSSWEPEAEKKRVRKSTPNNKSSGKHDSKVKNHQSRAKEQKAKIVPLPTTSVEHEPGSEPQDNAASDHSPDHNSPVPLPNRDNKPSNPAQNPGKSRLMSERVTNSTGKRKATTVKALPAKRKKVEIVERASKIRPRDDQKLQPTTPRTKSQRKAPLIHFTKHGPQNSGLLKPLNRKSNMPIVQSTPRTPLAATTGNLESTRNPLAPVLPFTKTKESATGSADFLPREASTQRLPPKVGSQTMIAENASPIPGGDLDSASVQDENSPPKENQTIVTPKKPGNRTMVNEQAHPKKLVIALKTRNPFGSGGPAQKTTFMDRLQASNDEHRREHNQGQRQDSMKPVATVQLGQQVEPVHEEPALWEDADTTMIGPESDLHRGEHTLRKQDETASSSCASEDPGSLKQFGGREPQQGKVLMALMEAAKVCISVGQQIRRLTDLAAN